MNFNKSLSEVAGIPTSPVGPPPVGALPVGAPAPVGVPPIGQSIADIPVPPVDTKKATDAAEGKVNKIQFERVAKEVIKRINNSTEIQKKLEGKIGMSKTPTALRLKYGGTIIEIDFKDMFSKK